jgi:mono/diheme cytochrome c family protein
MRLLKKLVGAALVLGVAGAVAGWFLSAPVRLDSEALAQLGPGDAARGKRIFYAGGCTSCHAKPGSQGDARLQLAGGLELKTPFGIFVPPNISQDATHGIGGWSVEDLANAMLKGVSPSGEHFYPAFPYASYARMKPADIADLHAFLKTLPAVAGKAPPNSLGFPFNIRRGIGLWKRLYLSDQPVVSFPDGTPDPVMAGRYLVEGPGHCGECHTPRNIFMARDDSRAFAGGPHPEGEGRVPSMRGLIERKRYRDAKDLVSAMQFGETLGYDKLSSGGMGAVQANLAKLPEADLLAIAEYLVSLK